MTMLMTGIKHAWRSLIRAPGPSLAVMAILGLGIAATVSIYSITAAVVLRPLPYAAPESLVQLRLVDPAEGYEYGVSGPTFLDWREAATSLETAAVASGPGRIILTDDGEPTRLAVTSVSGEFFRVLGVGPAVGRLLTPADAEAGAGVAVLSHALWRKRYGGSDVLGRVLRLGGEPYEVVGVAGPELELPRGTDVWTTLAPDAELMTVRYAHILSGFARLAGGVTPGMAAEELSAINARVDGYEMEARVVPLRDQLVGDFRTPLLILLGAVSFVLLVAAANAGTLLLARSARRRRELAIRDALGAGSARLGTQLLAESMLLALVAGAVGLLAAAWLLDGLVALAPAELPRAGEVRLDAGVMGFAVVVSLVTGLITGLIPTLQAVRTAPGVGLREGDVRAGGGRSGARAQRSFVVAAVALSVVLLLGAGLLGRSFWQIVSTDPGFDTDRVTTFEFALPGFRYTEDWQLRRYHDELLAGVRALPGVSAASLGQNLPVGGGYMVTPALVEGVEIEDPPRVQISSVSPGYFETLGLDVVSGRAFETTDGADAPPVAMVDEAFARLYFDGEDPVGRRARTYFGDPVMREIVGVVGSTVHASLTETSPEPKFYYPAAQFPPDGGRLVVRSERAAAALVPAVRRVAASVDPEVPLGEVATMAQLVARTTAQPRFYATTLTVFAALALMLAIAGFFAVLSQTVTARHREIGIRMALGGDPGRVLRRVVGDGMKLSAAGLAIGVLAGLAGGRVLRGLLYQVGPADPLVFVAVAALLGAAALAASWVPARRAAAVDPMEALRTE